MSRLSGVSISIKDIVSDVVNLGMITFVVVEYQNTYKTIYVFERKIILLYFNLNESVSFESLCFTLDI